MYTYLQVHLFKPDKDLQYIDRKFVNKTIALKNFKINNLHVNYYTRRFVIFLSYSLSFFKTLKIAVKTIIGLTICSVTSILVQFIEKYH